MQTLVEIIFIILFRRNGLDRQWQISFCGAVNRGMKIVLIRKKIYSFHTIDLVSWTLSSSLKLKFKKISRREEVSEIGVYGTF